MTKRDMSREREGIKTDCHREAEMRANTNWRKILSCYIDAKRK